MENNSNAPAQMMEMFTIKQTTPHNPQEIASQMQETCSRYNFSILQRYDFHEIIKSKGFELNREVFVFEICQAKIASKILADNPEFSIFMPCKIAIYEHGGETVIATMNMEMMLKIFENNAELYTEATALFTSLKEMIFSFQ
ncbi:DUF302 domain-containing protein [Flavobacterium sp.]|uniref:DUF302 domain-containing protein n=1 Tax=Flavobacterium sp. TaxID=239 RepID=UPI002B4AD17A|nr:DUF302 domain-containing protein [Flavobacterium sp.]HLF52916.1 DUF302 domain-containing protein [Flavobacterium sp.]